MDEGMEAPTDAKGEPQVAAGGPITATIPVRKGTRPISDRVREVFAASMAKSKARGAAGDEEGLMEPVDHEDLPTEAAAPVPGQAVEAAQPAPVAAQPVAAAPVPAPAPAVAAPPAPSLDPEVMRLRQELQQKHEAFEQERTQFQQERAQSDVQKLRDVYFDKGAPAVIDVIKQWMPGLEGEELKREVADLIQDLAHQYLEAPLEETVKDRITNKRVRAGLKTWKQEQERLEQERQKQLLASQQEQEQLQVKKILHQEVMKSEYASQFKWLSAEDNAGDLVFETIDQEYRKSGQQLSFVEAAKRVDDFLQKRSLAFFDKRKHLLSPQPPTPQTAPVDKQRAQGDQQVSRSHAQPKTQPKQQPKAQEPEARPVKWTPELHRQNTMSKFRGQLKALQDDE